MGKAAKIVPLIFVVVWIIFCFPFWGKGLIPAPLDFLTGFYGPWQSYQSLPIKNPAIPDVVSQIIPWKIFTISSLKNGIIPLWNIFNFSGSPHLENYQSSVFSLFNFLFFILPFVKAWSLFILLQPLLAGIFTYLFCRKLKISPLSSLISALCFSFGGFLTVWLEYGTLGWAIVWLPLVLYSLESYWENKKAVFQIIVTLGLGASFLSGHIQISLYVFAASIFYCVWQYLAKRIGQKTFWLSIGFIFLSLPLVAVQILPTFGYYLQSPRSGKIPIDWFKSFQIPFYFLVTFLFPNFFGHPVTRNFQVNASYVEMMGYIGLIPMVIIFAYILFGRVSRAMFFLVFAAACLLFALPTPLSNLLVVLKIPILSSSSPARIIGIISFSLAITAGFAMDYLLENLNLKNKKILLFFCLLFVLFIFIGGYGFFFNKIIFRNLLMPLGLYLLFLIFFTVVLFKKEYKQVLFSLVIVLLLTIDLFYFWNKFNPFTMEKDFYPSLPVVNFLKQNLGNNRVYGLLDDNLNLAFGIQTTSGYDSLNVREYQQLLSASKDGSSILPDRVTGEKILTTGKYSKNMMDLLGVKYVVSGKSDVYAFPTWEYPESFKLVWEDSKYKIFENTQALPRYFLSQNFRFSTPGQFLSDTLQNKNLRTVILDETPFVKSKEISKVDEIKAVELSNNEKSFITNSATDKILFLSDAYLPGWEAFLDGRKTKILKADFAFQAVEVPSGSHNIRLVYQPLAFTLGLYLTMTTLAGLLFWSIFDKLKHIKL